MRHFLFLYTIYIYNLRSHPQRHQCPQKTYKNKGWVNWGDWLGTDNIAPYYKIYRLFNDARDFIRSLNLKSQNEYKKFSKQVDFPKDLPVTPERTYKNRGWISWYDWLGKEK